MAIKYLIDGQQYRAINRNAVLGELVIITEEISTDSDSFVGQTGVVITSYADGSVSLEIDEVLDYFPFAWNDQYKTLELDPDATPEPTPDLVDLIIRLTRKVTELESQVTDLTRNYEDMCRVGAELHEDYAIISEQVDSNTKDIRTFADEGEKTAESVRLMQAEQRDEALRKRSASIWNY